MKSPSIADLAWLRLPTHLKPHSQACRRRNLQVMAFKAQPEVPHDSTSDMMHEEYWKALEDVVPQRKFTDRSLYARMKSQTKISGPALTSSVIGRNRGTEPKTELQRKVDRLKSLADIGEAQETQEMSTWDDYVPTYSEADLLDVYRDLLDATPTASSEDSTASDLQTASGRDRIIIRDLTGRLLSRPTRVTAKPVSESVSHSTSEDSSLEYGVPSSYSLQFSSKPHHLILSRLAGMIRESVSVIAENDPASHSNSHDMRLTSLEWSSLIRVCLREDEGELAAQALRLMQESHVSPEHLNDGIILVLDFYARKGDVVKTESILSNFVTEPNPTQRHLHVKAHLKSTPINTIPMNALSVVHQYENQNLPPPMKTYASLLGFLFSVPSSIAKAHAWDLFAHMRYVAHPDPDAYIYTLMIRACASAPPSAGTRVSEPERALDLWTEMIVEKMIPPTRDAYNSVILACARSGTRPFVNEAFRLAREMLNGYRNSQGLSSFKPDQNLFMALLDGAKRLGDLGRVRWILAEMVKAILSQRSVHDEYGMEVDDVVLNERIMTHVFHAYAAYKVPFRRGETVLVEEAEADHKGSEDSPHVQESDVEEPNGQEPEGTGAVKSLLFSALPPQSQTGVLAEVENLFKGIVEDNRIAEEDSLHVDDISPIFKHVRITAPLLNSYISVYYSHARFSTRQNIYHSVFQDHGIERNAHSYVQALEMCSCVIKGTRERALRFAEEIWSDWERFLETVCSSSESVARPSPRLVERSHIALIRIYGLNDKLDLAMEHLKAFARRYPPKVISEPVSDTKLPMRSTRTVLQTGRSETASPRPLVRLTSAVDVHDDTVQPFVTFSDLELLHNRLVAANRVNDIKYVKWVCKSYHGALRRRRDQTLKQDVAAS